MSRHKDFTTVIGWVVIADAQPVRKNMSEIFKIIDLDTYMLNSNIGHIEAER